MQKVCKIHGLTDFVQRKNKNRQRCKKCAVDAVTKRRRKVKLLAINYKGGKCETCGYNKCPGALDFHHQIPADKSFGIATKGHCRSWESIKLELDKCILLCRNCHAEKHWQMSERPMEPDC